MNRGFPFEDIETGAGNGSPAERLDQGCIVHHATPGGMDEDRRFLHEGDLRGADGMVGLPAVWDMDRHDIRPAEEVHLSGHTLARQADSISGAARRTSW